MPETSGEPLQLNCLIEGESAVFGLEVPSSAKVMDLKKAIKTEREEGTLKGVDSHILVLWKVDKIVENLTESQVTALQGKDGKKLWPEVNLVSTHWPATAQVLPNLLHIIVELPSGPDLCLWCWVEGGKADEAFKIDISGTKTVSELKELIWEKSKPAFDRVPTQALKIFKTDIDMSTGLEDSLKLLRLEDGVGSVEMLQAAVVIQEILPNPIPNHLHVVVGRPTIEPALKRKAFALGDEQMNAIRERWAETRPKMMIPPLVELKAIFERVIVDDQKIPILQELFNNALATDDGCQRRDMDSVFRVNDTALSISAFTRFLAAVKDRPPQDGTEDSYHSFWDRNVRDILQFVYPEARITMQPQPPPEPVQTWRDFLAERKRRNKQVIRHESHKDRQQRLDRLQNPPIASATVYRWVDNGNVPPVLVREPVPRHYRADVYHKFGERQRIYDPISNEWDLCEEFGAADDTGYDDSGDDDDDGYIPGPIEPNLDFQPPPQRSPSPPRIAEDGVVQDVPEIHEVLRILTDHYGFVKPSHIPPQVAAITPEERSLVLRTLGMAKEDDEIFDTCHGRIVVNFVSSLCSKVYPDPSCWDLSKANPQALARWGDHLKCMRQLADDLFVFNFRQQATVPWHIAVTTLADVLTVCRMDPNDRDITIARWLFSRGIPFKTLHPLQHVPRSIATAADLLLPYRPSGYQFTERDYDAYVHQRARILAGPRGRAALLRGGFVWRLAMQAMGFDDVLKGPSSDVMVHRNGFSVHNLWDDDLTQTELDLICGAYVCFTGSGNQVSMKSWWPLVGTYERMDCGGNFGRWTTWREEDYQHRLVDIQDRKAEPLGAKRWRDKLKGQKTARDMKVATAEFAERFLWNVKENGL